MKSKLAFGLAVSAGLTLAGIARADNVPADPVPLPAVNSVADASAQPAVTASPAVVDPAPTASILTPKDPPDAAPLPPATRLQAKLVTTPARRNAYLHWRHRQKDAHRVALMLEHRTAASLAWEEFGTAFHAGRSVPSAFLLGIGY